MVVATGCGDAVGDFRRDELRPLEKQADEHKARLSATLRTVQLGDADDARLLARQLQPLEAVFAELAKLDPPGEVEDTYAAYNKANVQFLIEMRRFIAALRKGDKAALNRSSERAQEQVGAALRAIQPIKEKKD